MSKLKNYLKLFKNHKILLNFNFFYHSGLSTSSDGLPENKLQRDHRRRQWIDSHTATRSFPSFLHM